MTSVPLGRGAFKRLYTGSPEVKLINRWVEANPTNLKEGVGLITRPGTKQFATFDPGGFTDFGSMRGNYTLSGLFADSLFVVCGDAFYKINTAGTIIHILGVINGTGHPEVTWQQGIDYQRLWIADGLLLQYYGGGTHATGSVTKVGAITNGVDKFELGGVYYTWGTVFSGSDAGTLSNPFVVAPLTDPMGQLNKAINFSGTPGVDYSSTLGGANVFARSATDGLVPAVTLTITSVSNNASSNFVTLSKIGTALTVSGPTLTGGNIHALQGCTIPDGQTPSSVTQVDSYVLVSITGTQKFYWINPGETTIDPLNFALKESSPDPIVQMRTVGDQVLIMGSKSTENWYATGTATAPFAPIQGRAYARGVLDGTAIVLDDSVYLAGDDGKVYAIGLQGVNSVSNNGIEERIRRQVRNELGLTP